MSSDFLYWMSALSSNQPHPLGTEAAGGGKATFISNQVTVEERFGEEVYGEASKPHQLLCGTCLSQIPS